MTDEELRKRSELHAAIAEALDCLQRIAAALERIEGEYVCDVLRRSDP